MDRCCTEEIHVVVMAFQQNVAFLGEAGRWGVLTSLFKVKMTLLQQEKL